jgi:hypothetical protein
MRDGFRFALGCAAPIGIASAGAINLAGGFARPYSVSVEDVSTNVGEKTMLVAKLTFPDGYEVLDTYNNRLAQSSSYDDGARSARSDIDAFDRVRCVVSGPAQSHGQPGHAGLCARLAQWNDFAA